MEIICIGAAFIRVNFRDIGKGLILGGSNSLGVAVACGFLESLVRPLTGDSEICLPRAVHQVKRDHGKLRRRTSLEEKNLVIIGNGHDLPQQAFRLVNDRLIFLGTVGHLHNRLTRPLVIEHFRSRRR